MCLDETLSSGIFKKQISTLVIIIDKNKEMRSTKNIMKNICNGIFPVFTNLLHLHFTEWTVESAVRLSFDFPPSMFFSSTLLELNIKVHRFDECLYLLDGRFNQLQTFYVNILSSIPLLSEIKQVGHYKKFFFEENFENPFSFFVLGRITRSKIFFFVL
jgi:hypothetical protein